ncbi:MAG TPA: L-serine ammonia-lyase [Caulobacteraceae bacterium]|nr:L-serine ammonia-lyase [Caulobacteraceae bacterium]
MSASVFDLFKLGVGPSSSHTMGPMDAARAFAARVEGRPVARVWVKLYASLALTGRGHGTDRAIVLGLSGFSAADYQPDAAEAALAQYRASHRLRLGGTREIGFDEAEDFVWAGRERLAFHPNALTFSALAAGGALIEERTWYSVGGGFIRDQDEIGRNAPDQPDRAPFDFASSRELLDMAARERLSIAELMMANETARFGREAVETRLDGIFGAMEACIERGVRASGELPGGLRVKRRAHQVLEAIRSRAEQAITDPLAAMDFVNLWALAVNEENAAGGRVVTAPTNGAAGIIPAVLRFYDRFYHGAAEGRRAFLLTAGAIGALYKRNASISGAEVGCQGEVGVACSMAAAGLAAALGGTNDQIENAAEIGMEHNLGLTCDPIGGLVQIPCIERNAMGAIKAIDAARLALLGDGEHSVSLDKVIATMKRTGADMSEIYKETSLGGLAVNLPAC